MAGVKLDKDSVEFQMFNDFWKMFQEFYEPDDSDEYWDGFIKAANDFLVKYKSHTLARMLTRLLDNYFTEKLKLKREHGM